MVTVVQGRQSPLGQLLGAVEPMLRAKVEKKQKYQQSKGLIDMLYPDKTPEEREGLARNVNPDQLLEAYKQQKDVLGEQKKLDMLAGIIGQQPNEESLVQQPMQNNNIPTTGSFAKPSSPIEQLMGVQAKPANFTSNDLMVGNNQQTSNETPINKQITSDGKYSSDKIYPIPKGAPLPPELISKKEGMALTALDPRYATTSLSMQSASLSDFERKVKYQDKVSSPIIAEAQKVALKAPFVENAYEQMMDSIINGDQSFFSNNNLAEVFNLPLLRDAKGAELKSATKDLYINQLQGMNANSVRNKWIEQTIFEAFTKSGNDEYANGTIAIAQEMKKNLTHAQAEITLNIADQWMEKLGYVPAQLQTVAKKELESYANQQQEEFIHKRQLISIAEKKGLPLRELPEFQGKNGSNSISIMSPNGELGHIKKEKLEAALKAGYKKI
jgi:hypothetical protein